MDSEDIASQHELLVVHRRTLAHLLKQAASYGGVILAPPQVALGIDDARRQIAQIKATLRAANVQIADDTADDPSEDKAATPLPAPVAAATVHTSGGDYAGRDIDKRHGQVFIDGSLFIQVVKAIGWQVGRDLFPRTPAPHVRVVASARQLANTSRTDWLDQLGWRAVQVAAVDLPGLDRTAVSDILRRMGNPLDVLASDIDLLTEIARVSQGDPLTIAFLVEALQDGSLTPGRLTSLPPGLEAFVRGWLNELEQRSAQREAVRAFLGLCATALGPLTIADLESLTPERFQARATLNQAAKSVARFIIGDGGEQSGYVLSHPRLRELFLEKVLSERERANLQQRFVTYGEEWYRGHLRVIGANTDVPSPMAGHRSSVIRRPFTAYLRQFWIAHLALAERWDLARATITDIISIGDGYDQPWATARYTAEGSYAGYLADLDRLWFHAEHQINFALGLRCALLVSSIRSLSANLTPELLVGLVTVGTPEGKWSPAAALEYVRQMADASRQVHSLQALLDDQFGISPIQMLEVVRSITDEQAQVQALQALAPHLPPDLLAEALAAARSITDEQAQVQLLQALIPHLPSDLLVEALTTARSIPDERVRAQALQALVPHLPPDLLAETFAATRTITDEEIQVQMLQALAVYLPLNEQSIVCIGALTTIRTITDEGARALLLQALIPYLPSDLLAEALTTIRTITHAGTRALLLQALIPYLPPTEQPTVYAEALTTIHTITNEWAQALLLQALIPCLPPTEQPIVCVEALAAARSIVHEETQVRTLRALAPHLPPTERPIVYAEALACARTIIHEQTRAQVLQALAPHLPPIERPIVYAEALATIHTITDERARAQALRVLAPHLPSDLLIEVLAAARNIADEEMRARLLLVLAPHLPPIEQPIVYAEALAAARTITHEQTRAQVLQALAPRLVATNEAIELGTRIYQAQQEAAAVQIAQLRAAIPLAPSRHPTHKQLNAVAALQAKVGIPTIAAIYRELGIAGSEPQTFDQASALIDRLKAIVNGIAPDPAAERNAADVAQQAHEGPQDPPF